MFSFLIYSILQTLFCDCQSGTSICYHSFLLFTQFEFVKYFSTDCSCFMFCNFIINPRLEFTFYTIFLRFYLQITLKKRKAMVEAKQSIFNFIQNLHHKCAMEFKIYRTVLHFNALILHYIKQ